MLAVAGMALAWFVLGQLRAAGIFGYLVISDISIYERFGDPLVRGQLPYRDFPLEYPPLALVVFGIPSLLRSPLGDIGAYVRIFELLMVVCALLIVDGTAVVLRLVRATPRRTGLALGLIAASPLIVGPLALGHYDLWPAALTALAIAALVGGRGRIGSVLLALAILAKVYPLVLAPLALALVYRERGRREAAICLSLLVGVVVLVVVPFAALAPSGVLDAVVRQVNRPLQVESLGAAALFVAHAVVALPVQVVSNFGSQNLAGALPDTLAILESLALGTVLVGTWIWYVQRGAPDREAFLRSAAISVAAYVALGKVLSPQYLVWMIPLVPLVAGRRGAIASGLLVAACVLTQAYFPLHYFDLADRLDTGVAIIVLLRDLTLLGVLVTLAVPEAVVAPVRRLERPARRVALAMSRIQPETALALVLLFALLVRAIWLWLPTGSLIFDEAYYVNAARVILGVPVPTGASYAGSAVGLDPNTEHPPLGKVLIAASMLIFGDNGVGWRVPSLVAGMLGLGAVYRIVRNAGEAAWLGVLAVAIYSLDILSFIHGRIGTLDMMATGLMLLGASLALRHRWMLAGIALASATLVKETAVLGLLAVLVMYALDLYGARRRGERLRSKDVRPVVALLTAFSVVSLGGLWLLDLRFTTYTNPIEHVFHMLGYGMGLTGGPSPSGIASNPWDWLVNGGQFDYLKVAVNVLGPNGELLASHASVDFRALMNPIMVGALALSVPTAFYLAWTHGHRLATWAAVWMAVNYLPFVYLGGIAHRISYLYYVLPTIPAFAVATALVLCRLSLPRPLTWTYLGASLAAFVAYFPFRILP
jgi:predicted membrane-bound dolichyl-phosphate-mannose-protein mannosyltransferase